MNHPELTPGPDKPVRDECWELMTRPPELTTTQAVFSGLLAHGKSLPMRLALAQSSCVHGSSSRHLEEGEQS
ncbi:hypothetical protein [Streptomyces sp. NPDC057889]|uniref:hypothetical protein n=1 Tax=unclassified Streptomyces TaxID=2593676 RepID=UPI003696885A